MKTDGGGLAHRRGSRRSRPRGPAFQRAMRNSARRRKPKKRRTLHRIWVVSAAPSGDPASVNPRKRTFPDRRSTVARVREHTVVKIDMISCNRLDREVIDDELALTGADAFCEFS